MTHQNTLLTQTQKCPISFEDGHILVDIREVNSVDRDAREIYANNPSSQAVALVIGNPVSRILGNFFLGVNKNVSPLKLFTSEQEALNWLITTRRKVE